MRALNKNQVLAIGGVALLSIIFVMIPQRRAASASASPPYMFWPPAPPAAVSAYTARGHGTMLVDGAGCCDGVVFPSTFELEYETDPASSRVRITRLSATLADMDVAFHFLIFETGRMQVRCGAAHNESIIEGDADVSGNLVIGAGAATLSGQSFQRRDPSGDCGGPSSAIRLTNNAALTGLLDPASNLLTLSGAFTSETEGRTYNVRLDMSGEYVNRPPVAVFGVEGRGLEAYVQGGCPAVVRGGNPPEAVVEANDPAGLKMYLRSFSRDPDGAWNGADIRFDQWFYARDLEPYKFIGESRRLGPELFEFGVRHHLTLETTDRAGVTSAANCDFRVVDTTPPAVTAPGSISVASSSAGGATPATSDALRNFLSKSAATDAVDPGPVRLPSLLNGKEVSADTLFPAGICSSVMFRFMDKFSNTGTASSTVCVNSKK